MKYSEPDTLVKNAEGIKVEASVVVSANARSVWEVVGNFSGFDVFIPALSHIEMTGSGIRSLRKKFFKDGNVVVEQLNSHHDEEMIMTWSLIYTSLNIGNLWARMEVKAKGESQSEATWIIVGEPWTGGADSLPAFREFLQGFASGAMENVKQLFV